jgi:hypothetical protein
VSVDVNAKGNSSNGIRLQSPASRYVGCTHNVAVGALEEHKQVGDVPACGGDGGCTIYIVDTDDSGTEATLAPTSAAKAVYVGAGSVGAELLDDTVLKNIETEAGIIGHGCTPVSDTLGGGGVLEWTQGFIA